MAAGDDPLWYDREEPEEPLGLFALMLLAVFVVYDFTYAGFVTLFRVVRTGVTLAFRDTKA
ncbi:hypothetical protein [Methylobacterium flocculans]|uniref:hypothetical protein n=1 Tax=Methylobacterium flocculans TaxID=2984843 RepID=UPI0021F341BD|nr:hypothetical protein [Methylobacterium sp. FF17]